MAGCERCREKRKELLRKLRRTQQSTAQKLARLKPTPKAIV